jgi:hypothetical protein
MMIGANNTFQGHNIIVLVGQSLYQAIQNITGIVGITPLELLEGIGGIIVTILLIVIVQGMRGKNRWSLDNEISNES